MELQQTRARLIRMPSPVLMFVRSMTLPTVQTATIQQLVSNDTTMLEGKDDVSYIVDAMVHAAENEETPVMEGTSKSESLRANKNDLMLDFAAVSNDTMLKSEQSLKNVSLLDNDYESISATATSTPRVTNQVAPQQISKNVELFLIEPCKENKRNLFPECRICKKDGSKKELIKLCNCTTLKLAHLDCLEKRLKDRSTHYCKKCRHCLQIKRRDRPFSQWWKKRAGLLGLNCSIICLLIWIIFPYFMVYLFMKDTKCLFQDASIHTKFIYSFIIIIWLMGYLYGFRILIFKTRRYWERWYRNNQDIKLAMYRGKPSRT